MTAAAYRHHRTAPLWLLLARNLTVPFALFGVLTLAGATRQPVWLASTLVCLAGAVVYRPDLIPPVPHLPRHAVHAAAWVAIAAALAAAWAVDMDWSGWLGGEGLLYTSGPRDAYWRVVLPVVASMTLVARGATLADRRGLLPGCRR